MMVHPPFQGIKNAKRIVTDLSLDAIIVSKDHERPMQRLLGSVLAQLYSDPKVVAASDLAYSLNMRLVPTFERLEGNQFLIKLQLKPHQLILPDEWEQ